MNFVEQLIGKINKEIPHIKTINKTMKERIVKFIIREIIKEIKEKHLKPYLEIYRFRVVIDVNELEKTLDDFLIKEKIL